MEDFYNERNRLRSFETKFDYRINKERLARAGFYHVAEPDTVQCYCCKVIIRDWNNYDHPFIEHKIHSPNCAFLYGIKTNIPIPETEHLFLEERATIAISSGRYPQYSKHQKRLDSFKNWPSEMKQTPEELSNAGFFYLGTGDEVKCFWCGGCIRNFKHGDSVIEEHTKYYFERCLFVKFKIGN